MAGDKDVHVHPRWLVMWACGGQAVLHLPPDVAGLLVAAGHRVVRAYGVDQAQEAAAQPVQAFAVVDVGTGAITRWETRETVALSESPGFDFELGAELSRDPAAVYMFARVEALTAFMRATYLPRAWP